MNVWEISDVGAFRTAVRAWIAERLKPDWRSSIAGEEDYIEAQRAWMAKRAAGGLAVPGWPREFGGADLPFKHQLVLADEMARANAPDLDLFMVSLNHVPATLLSHGTPAQRDRYLPGVPAGDIWCQGFSEPNAGSDLASLRTRARREGDEYVISGQKIWSSYSRFAKYCLLLARTDPDVPKHRGISYFIMPMDSEGLEIRPIRQATGESEFSELFLDDVRLPAENLIGAENDGWRIAQSTLSAERGILAFDRAERLRYRFEKYLAQSLDSDRPWTKNRNDRLEFIQLYTEMQSGRRLVRKLLSSWVGSSDSESLPLYIKLSSTMLLQKFGDFMVRTSGLDGQVLSENRLDPDENPMVDYIRSFGDTISAGSNEIMRNVIAERVLGLPK